MLIEGHPYKAWNHLLPNKQITSTKDTSLQRTLWINNLPTKDTSSKYSLSITAKERTTAHPSVSFIQRLHCTNQPKFVSHTCMHKHAHRGTLDLSVYNHTHTHTHACMHACINTHTEVYTCDELSYSLDLMVAQTLRVTGGCVSCWRGSSCSCGSHDPGRVEHGGFPSMQSLHPLQGRGGRRDELFWLPGPGFPHPANWGGRWLWSPLPCWGWGLEGCGLAWGSGCYCHPSAEEKLLCYSSNLLSFTN